MYKLKAIQKDEGIANLNERKNKGRDLLKSHKPQTRLPLTTT